VVEAYAAGTIELPQPEKVTSKDRLRNAPSFAMQEKGSHDPCDHPYTAETIQEFLGFKGDAGLNRIKDTLNALALIEGGTQARVDRRRRGGRNRSGLQRTEDDDDDT
jgi:hypothetical protein